MPDVFTDADILLEILAEKDKVPIPIVAHVLGVSEEVVEKWAKVLEKHGMIKIQYPILGKPVLEVAAPEKIKDELRAKFLEEHDAKSIKISEEADMYEEKAANVQKDEKLAFKKELDGKMAKVTGLSKTVEMLAQKLGVDGERIISRYRDAESKYREMIKKLDQEISQEGY